MAKKLSGSVSSGDPVYDFSGPMFDLYKAPRDETDEEKRIRLINRAETMRVAPSFTPDYPTPADPYRSLNYMSVADTASALGIPMPAPVGPNNMYSQQQAADFVAANPVPNRLGIQVMSPQDALAMRQRQAQAMRAIQGSAPILSPRGFEPTIVSDGIFNRLKAMLGY
jgi:hypothetical protein